MKNGMNPKQNSVGSRGQGVHITKYMSLAPASSNQVTSSRGIYLSHIVFVGTGLVRGTVRGHGWGKEIQ